MKPFTFQAAESLDDAVQIMADGAGTMRPIAGGQSLLLELKDRLTTPTALLSLRRVRELRTVKESDDGAVEIGATVTYRDLTKSASLNGYSGIGLVAGNIADIPVRTMATIGGALCQAESRFDMPAVLLALDATVHLSSADGTRAVAMRDFMQGPRATARQPTELLTRISLPARSSMFRWSFEKFRTRAMDAALVSVTVAGNLGEDRVLQNPAVVVAGCVGAPTRMAATEELLANQVLGERSSREAADQLMAGLEPDVETIYFDADYKRHLAGVLLQRALSSLSTNEHGD